ncbi:MAG: hypothetical protein MUO76_09265 [Anaerolineaceae bacterium]|nr:hypothetical protein [Anaerolineaceae bacterium]
MPNTIILQVSVKSERVKQLVCRSGAGHFHDDIGYFKLKPATVLDSSARHLG